MGVHTTAVTRSEAEQYRAAGWWTETTLSDRVAYTAASSPTKPAYIDFFLGPPATLLTWSEFDHAATNLAHRLFAVGVTPGEGVAVWHKDGWAIHVLLVAIERCGAIAVGLGARTGVREATAILRTARPVLIVTDADRLAQAQQAADDADLSIRVLVVGQDLEFDTAPPADGMDGLSPVGPDDVFLINSTSGTTGLPKCVVHTQNRWHYFHQKAVANGDLTADDVFLPSSPCRSASVSGPRIRRRFIWATTVVKFERFDADRDVRSRRTAPRYGAVLCQHAIGDDSGQSGLAGATT